jgi:hypothetical protein
MQQNNGGPDFSRFLDWKDREEMRKEIEDLKEQLSGNHLPVKEEKYSHGLQLLILDYLGIGKHLKTNVAKAKFYAPIIRRDFKTTEQYLTRLNTFKNVINLELIIDFFSKADFPNQVQEAKNDLDRLKQRKH